MRKLNRQINGDCVLFKEVQPSNEQARAPVWVRLDRFTKKIPIDLLQLSLSKGLTNPARIFIFLKLNYNGKVWNYERTCNVIRAELGIKDKRTVKKHIRMLMGLRWVGYNQEIDLLHIRSWDTINQLCKFRSKAACFYESKFYESADHFRAFAAAAIISKHIRWLDKKIKIDKRGQSFKGRDFSNGPSYRLYSNSLLANLLKCSKKTASELRNLAHQYRYIFSEQNFLVLDSGFEDAPNLKAVNSFRAKYGIAGYVTKRKGIMCVQTANKIYPEIRLGKLKRLQKR